MTTAAAPRKTLRRRLWRAMYDAGWNRHEGTVRHRLTEVVGDRRPWYDWGHPLMSLVGRYRCGNTEFPRGEDLWWIPTEYVEGPAASWLADFEQRNGCYITWSFKDVQATRDVPWRIFDLQDDGHTIVIGLYPHLPEHDGRIQPLPVWSSMNAEQMRLFLWWFLVKHKGQAQWLGARTWLYGKALHAAVAQKIPFTCQITPAKGSGGYGHWHCQLRRRHAGAHRFRNYTWMPGSRVEHAPHPLGASR